MTERTREPTAQGELDRYPFPRLFYYIYKKALLGELEIRPPNSGPMRIFFREGIPVRVDVPTTEDELGRILLERGWISEEAFQRSLEEMAKGEGSLQGRILLSIGALDAGRLVEGLVLQLRRKLYRFFSFADGQFAIYAGEHSHGIDAEAAYVRADPLFVIYQGVRNGMTPERLTAELARLDHMAVGLHPEFSKVRERYGLSEDDAPVVELLAQEIRPVAEVFRLSHLGPVQTQMLLYAFWVTEVLVAKPAADLATAARPETAKPVPASPPSAAARGVTAAPVPQGAPAAPEARDLAGAVDATSGAVPAEGGASAVSPPSSTARLRAMEERPITPPSTQSQRMSTAPRKRQLTQDPGQVQATVQEAFGRIKDQNYFEVLGVSGDASADVIREAYFKLAKTFHPDRITAYGIPGLADKAQEIFRVINEANTVLTDREQRRAYEDKLAGKGGEDEAGRVAAEAEFAFQKGIVFFRKHNYAAARTEFGRAVELSPKEGEHLAWLAWALYNDPKVERETTLPKVKQQLLEAISLSPKSAICHYYLGEVYLALDEPKRALTCFNKTLEIDPKHIGAQRHLRLIQMRKERSEKNGAKGLFSRFRRR